MHRLKLFTEAGDVDYEQMSGVLMTAIEDLLDVIEKDEFGNLRSDQEQQQIERCERLYQSCVAIEQISEANK